MVNTHSEWLYDIGGGAGWYKWNPEGDTSGVKVYNSAGTGNGNASTTQNDFLIPECDRDVEPVTVLVSHDSCEVGQTGPVGAATAAINPDGAAVVMIYDDDGELVGTIDSDGGSVVLAPGTYSWEATPAAGFALTGETSGEFTIDPCDASVIVSHEDCSVNEGVPAGSVSVLIDTDPVR